MSPPRRICSPARVGLAADEHAAVALQDLAAWAMRRAVKKAEHGVCAKWAGFQGGAVRKLISMAATAALATSFVVIVSAPAAHAAGAATVQTSFDGTTNDIIITDAPGNSATFNTLSVYGVALVQSNVPLSIVNDPAHDCSLTAGTNALPYAILCAHSNDEVFVHGGDGNDTITATYPGNTNVEGGTGSDTINAGAYVTGRTWVWADQVQPTNADGTSAGDGNDGVTITSSKASFVELGGGLNVARGGAGSDSIDGGPSLDWITGGAGRDFLNGGAGSDSLAGNGGNDVLTGGTGSDTLNGGLGTDTFYAQDGTYDHVIKGCNDGVVDYVYADAIDSVTNC
jgi:Ca2+-binding RTX toxin-like protein